MIFCEWAFATAILRVCVYKYMCALTSGLLWLIPPRYLMAQIYTKGFECKNFMYIIILSTGITTYMCGLSTKTKIFEKKWYADIHWMGICRLVPVPVWLYSAAQVKWHDFLHPITWLFLDRFLIFLDESYRAWRMQAIDTKHIKIGQFVKELWHLGDPDLKKVNLSFLFFGRLTFEMYNKRKYGIWAGRTYPVIPHPAQSWEKWSKMSNWVMERKKIANGI